MSRRTGPGQCRVERSRVDVKSTTAIADVELNGLEPLSSLLGPDRCRFVGLGPMLGRLGRPMSSRLGPG